MKELKRKSLSKKYKAHMKIPALLWKNIIGTP